MGVSSTNYFLPLILRLRTLSSLTIDFTVGWLVDGSWRFRDKTIVVPLLLLSGFGHDGMEPNQNTSLTTHEFVFCFIYFRRQESGATSVRMIDGEKASVALLNTFLVGALSNS